jgi:predicted nucleic acid-binding protein
LIKQRYPVLAKTTFKIITGGPGLKTQKIYLDTSVFGGCFDEEFERWSNGILQDINNGLFSPSTSDIVSAELFNAPKPVQDIYKKFMFLNPEMLEVNTDVEMLVDSYIGHRILTEKFKNDMLHIALASVYNIDILISWNFKHIVHYEKIVKFNAVNLELGFRQLMILSPREVTSYGEN